MIVALHECENLEASVAVQSTSWSPTGRPDVSVHTMVGSPLASVAAAPMSWVVPSSTVRTEVGHVIMGGVVSATQGCVKVHAGHMSMRDALCDIRDCAMRLTSSHCGTVQWLVLPSSRLGAPLQPRAHLNLEHKQE